MKSLLRTITIVASFLILCSFTQPADSVLLEMWDEESAEYVQTDFFVGITDTVHLSECHASIVVPEGFVFLDRDEAKRLLVDYWGNPEDRAEDLLGAYVPNTAKAYFQVQVAYFIKYDNCGYIRDDDANSVDYKEMMEQIKEAEIEENENLAEEDRLVTIGWEFNPKYLAGSHVLVWAKRLSQVNGEVVNYDMRVLGKDGLVSLMAVVDPEDSREVQQREQSIINSLKFDEGYAYSDFDETRDKVSDWTLGGLVAGGILAKSGLLTKIGLFLLKGWKVIALAVAGGLGAFFKTKKKKDETTGEEQK